MRIFTAFIAAGLLAVATGCSGTVDSTSAPDIVPAFTTSAPSTSSTTLAPTTTTTTIAEPTPTPAAPEPPDGFSAVFIGHSFFQPPASRIGDVASRAGFTGHRQATIFGGGAGGAPEALWNDESQRFNIVEVLSRGDVDLFGMTYHPDFPTLTGYRSWVEEALAHNPNTAFFVGMPWLLDPASMTAAEYTTTWLDAYDRIVPPILQGLRETYPGVAFFGIPYGRAAAALYQLLDRAELPGITNLIGDGRSSLFQDGMGHAGELLTQLSTLVWLRAIYCVDLSSYDHESSYSIDLRPLAAAIVADQNPDETAPWCRTA